jgi:hypothetical protein
MRFDHRQRRQAFGMARSAGCRRADDQAVAVLHYRVANETQPRFFAWSFAKQSGIGVGGRGMRVVPAALAAEVELAITTRA